MLARASRIDVPLAAGGAASAEGAGVAEALPRAEPRAFAGGLPGGVVDSSIISHVLDYMLIPDNEALCMSVKRQTGCYFRGKRTLRWCIELFFERLEHWCRECLTLLPDVKEFLNLVLLLFGGGLQNVIHQNRHEFCHSVDASGIGSIRSRAVYCLRLRLGLLEPFSGYRVYDVEYPQLVCSRCLFEMRKDFLNKN
jgi:hypothetical protein